MIDKDSEKRDIILFGYGKFGKQMYAELTSNGYSVKLATMLDKNYKSANNDKIEDIKKFNPKHNDSIKMIGINPQKDMLYCAMDHTLNNLFLVLSLRELYREATIIAVSNSNENSRKLKYAGANTIIDIYEASAQHLVTNVTKPAVSEALNTIVFEKNDLKIAEIVLEYDTFLEGKYTIDIDFYSRGLILIAIIDREIGDDLIYITKGIDHKFDGGDTLVVAGKGEDILKFKDELR